MDYTFPDWKGCFHYSLFYLINHDQKALELIQTAAARYRNSGRLAAEVLFIDRMVDPPEVMIDKWAALVNELPKSGEVWCEGGRIHMELQDW